MIGQRNDPTQDELDFMLRRGFVWMGEHPNKWLFEKNGLQYDLSAADILQIDRIETDGLFLVQS